MHVLIIILIILAVWSVASVPIALLIAACMARGKGAHRGF